MYWCSGYIAIKMFVPLNPKGQEFASCWGYPFSLIDFSNNINTKSSENIIITLCVWHEYMMYI